MKKRNFIMSIFAMSLIFVFSACSEEEIDDRDLFEGTWRATESFVFNGESQEFTYTFTITKSSGNEQNILLTGFAGEPSETITASVNGSSFVIPQQTIISAGESVGISGSGSINGSSITFSYNASFVDAAINVSGTATKL